MYDFLKRLKDRQLDMHFPVAEITTWCRQHLARTAGPTYRILDIGLGTGRELNAIRDSCKEYAPELYGVESREDHLRAREADGITASRVDIERQALPYQDQFFDIVLSSHVI